MSVLAALLAARHRAGGGTPGGGGGGGGTEPYWTVAATRGRYCSTAWSAGTSRTDVSTHLARGTIRSLKLHWNAVTINSGVQTITPTAITRRVAVRHPNGTLIEGTWEGGGTTGTVPAGGWAVCDIDLTAQPVYKGQTFTLQTYSQVPSGGVIPVAAGDYLSTTRGEGWVSGVDSHMGTPSGLASGYGVMPQVIVGQTTTAGVESWALLGDSIMTGSSDSLWGVAETGGWGDRLALLRGGAMSNYARGGDKAATVGPQTVWDQRHNAIGSHTRIVCEYGFNDFYVAGSTAQLQGWMLPLWQRLRTLAPTATIYASTITPYGLSTPTWPTKDPYRQATNTWLRDGAPLIAGAPAASGTTDPSAVRVGQTGHPLSHVLDVAVLVEATTAGVPQGYWADPAEAPDAIHPTAAAHTRIAAALLAAGLG